MNAEFTESQKRLLRRIRDGEVLSCAISSDLCWWIDSYQRVPAHLAKHLIICELIEVDESKKDNGYHLYKLTELGKTISI